MISIEVTGLENLIVLTKRISSEDIKELLFGIIDDEFYTFSRILRMDPLIPLEYSRSLSSAIVRELDTIALLAWGSKRWDYRKFGSRLEWGIYMCPKRKYFGGELSPEYSGPDYLKERWEKYRSTFITNVKDRIITVIRET